MKKLNEIKNMYKNNRHLFNIIVLIVNIVLIFWQTIFTLIVPSRGNTLVLLILIIAFVYQLFKDS